MKTPDYVLKEKHTASYGPHETLELPAGAFVRLIQPAYVPKHILDANRLYNKATEVFVYCRYGIVLIPRYLIRQTE